MRGGITGSPRRGGGPGGRGGGGGGGGGGGAGTGSRTGQNQGPGPTGTGGKIPFDLTYFEDIFPRVFPTAPDDTELTALILKRNTEISATNEEIQAIQSLVTRVQGILENIILAPGAFDACQVEEVRQVGSFKQLTILNGHKTADFVVILKTLPTKEAVEALCNKIADELRQTECVRHSVTPRGFDISNVQATVRIMITTIPQNLRKLDPELHLDAKLMNDHLQAIRHSRWFEENAHNSTIKVIIRLLRDMRQRFVGLQCLSTWMMDMLAHYATMNNPNRVALPVNQAFRRVISLIGGGFYLPGYAGTSMRNHNLTLEDMDQITTTGQTLLRVLGHGGHKAILGLEGRGDIVKAASVWNGVVVLPSELVYEKGMDVDEGDEDEAVEENGGSGTAVN